METFGEIIPFAKEMLNQRPSKGMLKIYVLGSSLTMLAVVGGLVEMLLLPSGEQETAEDTPAELITERTVPAWDSGGRGRGHSSDYGTEKLNQPLTTFLKNPPDFEGTGYVDGSGGKLYHGAQLIILCSFFCLKHYLNLHVFCLHWKLQDTVLSGCWTAVTDRYVGENVTGLI